MIATKICSRRELQLFTYHIASAILLMMVILPFAVPYAAQSRLNVWTTNAPAGQYYTVAVDPTNSNIIYAGGGSFMVRKSVDGGATWALANTGFAEQTYVAALKVHPANPRTLYAATGDGVYKSTNGAANWTQVYAGYVLNIEISPSDGNVIYAIGNELYVSVDGGANWVVRQLPIIGNIRSAMVVHPGNPALLFASLTNYDDEGVYVTGDSGASWQFVSFLGYCQTLKFDSEMTLYAGGSRNIPGNQQWGVYKSTDLGQNWSFFVSHQTPNEIMELAIDPINSDYIYVGTLNDGILVTANGGTTWKRFNAGIPFPLPVIRTLTFDQRGGLLHAAAWPLFNSGSIGGLYTVRLRNTRL